MTPSIAPNLDGRYRAGKTEQRRREDYRVFVARQRLNSEYNNADVEQDMSKISDNSLIRDLAVYATPVLLTALLAASAYIWNNLNEDIKEIKSDQKTMSKDVSDFRLQLTKSVATLEKDLAVNNQKLEDIGSHLRKKSGN